jgi:hypothetical protein
MRQRIETALYMLFLSVAAAGCPEDEPVSLGRDDIAEERDDAQPDADDASAADEYDPCKNSVCGHACDPCAPDDATCEPTAERTACDREGRCVAASEILTCQVDQPPGEYEPCGGKACGAPCTLCRAGDADCVESDDTKWCTPDGECVPVTREDLCSSVSDPDPEPEPEPDPEPTPDACEAPLAEYTPGCAPAPDRVPALAESGCYLACEGGRCALGTTCTTVWANKSCPFGETCATDECGVVVELCLPD